MTNNNNIGAAKIAAYAAIIVSVVGNVTIYLDSRSYRVDARDARQDIRIDAKQRVKREDQFFRSQCHRDFVRDNVIILSLQDAIHRAKASIPPGRTRNLEVRIIQSRIDTIESFRQDCEASIPD